MAAGIFANYRGSLVKLNGDPDVYRGDGRAASTIPYFWEVKDS